MSLGHYYFEIASLLRETLFINSFLWNMETWYNLRKTDLEEIEKIDRILIKRILNVPSSTPTSLLYLELGIVPLRYIIQARRLTFLRYILTRKDDDLLLKFFKAQLREPSKNDWCETVKDDLVEFEIGMDFEQIKKLSKLKWKKIVKKAMRSKAFEDLTDKQLNNTKGENLSYGQLEMRKYFSSKNIKPSQANLIFNIRTNMINVKTNYSHSYIDFSCPCCEVEIDTQEHMFTTCQRISLKLTQKEYTSIFGQNEEKMEKILHKLETIEAERRTILEIKRAPKIFNKY